MFNPKPIIQQLELNTSLFKTMFTGVSDEQSRWKPSPEKWSILEVACHLVYEENHDFKARLEYALNNFRGELPPIDSEGCVNNADLSKTNLNSVFYLLKGHREINIAALQLAEYNQVNWDNTLIHKELGEMSAKLILSNWLAHDYLHIRQILSLKHKYLAYSSQEDLKYAGNW